MRAHVHACVCSRACIRVCARVCLHIRRHGSLRVSAEGCSHVGGHVGSCDRSPKCPCVHPHVSVHAYMRVCVRILCECSRVWALLCLRVYTCVPISMLACVSLAFLIWRVCKPVSPLPGTIRANFKSPSFLGSGPEGDDVL